jgi:hypothetical protein
MCSAEAIVVSSKSITAVVMAGIAACGNITATRIPNSVGAVDMEVREDIREALGVITTIATTIMATTTEIGATMIETATMTKTITGIRATMTAIKTSSGQPFLPRPLLGVAREQVPVRRP